ncbi:MAG: hypothetical protein ACXW5U_15025 [Thermoanaerobaculia bacterium]
MTRRLLPAALFAAFTLAAFGAIRSYDLFWQLATGRWIVEHRALPLADPFALASDKSAWIDGEWLYEVALYGAHSLVGLEGLSWLRGLLAAAIFTIAFVATRRESESALLVSAIAFAGAMPVLDLRPSGIAALMVVLMLAARSLWARVLIAIVWMNVHPSALLAPILAGVSGGRPDAGGAARWKPALRDGAACVMALLVNPFGWRGVAAPIELMSFVRGGTFVNAEWLPSPPTLYPILYGAIVVAIIAFALEPRRDWKRIALLALFAYLAVRHVRNQPLFFAAFAMLVHLPRLRPLLVHTASAIAIVIVGATTDHRLGVPPERFPIEAVAHLQASGLQGNIYNPDQFGGFLIWSFYPERRVLTDGRNELYRTFIPEWQQAREDGRKWNALLRKYDIDIAVEEYRAPLRVTNAATGEITEMPAHLAYWPQDQWVMIAKDGAAMVFVRRSLVSSRARTDR